ncbi:unnamed protein product [Onchocerca flexuosa]|uniref:Serine/threonine-protein phosphatase 4 catalytic subunit n=1 Tax=Onchocerca flexuosa TaxID=387005 RepID=A0A183HQ54_9BILA|nr:unnamed protein product [Onchocerca flexuosa]
MVMNADETLPSMLPSTPTSVTVNDLDRQIETLMRCECISEQEVKSLCAKAREILLQEGNVQVVDSPVTVIFYYLFEFSKFFKFDGMIT